MSALIAFVGFASIAAIFASLLGLLIAAITKKKKRPWLIALAAAIAVLVVAFCLTEPRHVDNSGSDETNATEMSALDSEIDAFKRNTVFNPNVSGVDLGDGTFEITLEYPKEHSRYDDPSVCGGDAMSVLNGMIRYQPEAFAKAASVTFNFSSDLGSRVVVVCPGEYTEGSAVTVVADDAETLVTPDIAREGYGAIPDGQSSATSPSSGSSDSCRDNFIADMAKYYSFDHANASAAYDRLCELGCEGAKVLGGQMTNNVDLVAMRAIVDGHQINFTAENGTVFYVQITGWSRRDYGWYINWRDKLRYGEYDKKLAFDLYDADSGGYLAYYEASSDSVVPWGER